MQVLQQNVLLNSATRVSDWFTFNEPMVVVECAYLLGFHYPDIVDGKKSCSSGLSFATRLISCD